MAAVVRAVVLDRPQPHGGGHPFGVRIRSDVGHHCPHLCRLLGKGDDPRHDTWRGATRLGEASSSRLVSRGEQGREMTKINVIQPGTIEAPPGEIPFLPLPEASRATIARLKDMDDASLERMAETLLAGDNDETLDRAAIPFIGAALQAYWLHLVTALGAGAFGRLEVPHLCPACGSAPMVSVVCIGADHGLRYLTCPLCSTQWHAVRIKCVFCDTTKGIAYYGIEGGSDAVKAESCDACHGYLKILYMEKDPNVDALADDVASIALDVLMAESGITRRGTNFFLY